MGKYIITFDDNSEVEEDGVKYFRCTEVPWSYTSEIIISKLTPYTEPDTEKVNAEKDKIYDEARARGYDEGRARGYQEGLFDAWEAARKIGSNSMCSLKEIGFDFGQCVVNDYNPSWFVVKNYSASECIEKIRQYEHEQEKIKVGDEVIGIYSSGEQTKPFVITKWDSNYYFGIYSDSGKPCQGGLKLQKTGRHFPAIAEAAEVLRKMQK